MMLRLRGSRSHGWWFSARLADKISIPCRVVTVDDDYDDDGAEEGGEGFILISQTLVLASLDSQLARRALSIEVYQNKQKEQPVGT